LEEKEITMTTTTRMNCTRARIILSLGILLTLTAWLAAPMPVSAADAYPSKMIRLVIPFPPAGSNDIIGRLIANKLSARLGKPVIVDNRAGAGGVIGADMVANSAPDGHTLLLIAAGHAINPALYKLPYDHDKSFVPIAMLGSGPNVLTVYPGLPVNSLKELIALAKKQPGKLFFSSSGVGSFMHLGTELFKMMADIDFTVVQFRGGGPAMTDTMGGHTQAAMGTLTQSLPQIRSGKLKVLAVGGSRREKLLPDVPTIAEAGVPGYVATNWWGILAPAGTPKTVTDRLEKELAIIVNSEETKKMFEAQGAEAELTGSAEFGKFIVAETAKWGKVVRQANIKVDEK
jgi:tripartite-type tricarboxylate transporter receptor subunit TctC